MSKEVGEPSSVVEHCLACLNSYCVGDIVKPQKGFICFLCLAITAGKISKQILYHLENSFNDNSFICFKFSASSTFRMCMYVCIHHSYVHVCSTCHVYICVCGKQCLMSNVFFNHLLHYF